jgi:hypothetical protein
MRRKPVAKSYETIDDAIRALREQLEPGAELALHAEDCAIVDGQSDDACTCIPTILIGGAQA